MWITTRRCPKRTGGMVAAYTYDEVHPTAAGYDVMEKILPPVVDAVLKNPKRYRRR